MTWYVWPTAKNLKGVDSKDILDTSLRSGDPINPEINSDDAHEEQVPENVATDPTTEKNACVNMHADLCKARVILSYRTRQLKNKISDVWVNSQRASGRKVGCYHCYYIFRDCVPQMFVISYSVTDCIYIPGNPGFCFHCYCAVYDEFK